MISNWNIQLCFQDLQSARLSEDQENMSKLALGSTEPGFWSNNSESLINKNEVLKGKRHQLILLPGESSCIIVHHLYTRYTRPLNPC